jgi:predicted RNA binding protein YcfA (HicA-like mRNA interferase family)
MKQVSGKAFLRIALDHGWVLDRIKGSHHIMIKDGEDAILTIPVHANKPLKIGLLRALMKQTGLSENDL